MSETPRKPKPKRNWIQEERRQTLGDWVSCCLACGHGQRYFEPDESLLPAACPFCAGEMRHRCPDCDALLPSAFQIACEEGGAELRPNELFGIPIRKPGR